MTPEEREQLLLRLCGDALAKDAGERAAFLDEACAGDAALREEVESLLAGHAEAQAFLESQEWAPGTPPLTAGTRFGPYEIQSFIGAGGMGQVYKARDTRLGRTVAIKVLPPELAAHSERRRRFEQEARAASALNDPHICTLHDIGSDNGTDYLVMEYLEGETLAARLRKGRLPVEQALDYATQIADALSKAHRQGIVHRDLKPGNVMLTKSGAKLLDFGLAKLRAPAGAAVSASFTTREKSITAEGTLLGTVPYMAPEQLEGKEADARSDLFSFGTLLYEMLSGKRAFEGESHASVIAAILEHEPAPLSSLQPVTPPALDRLVRRCLMKSPDDRPDTAHDVSDDLRWVREASSDGAAATVPTRRGKVVHTALIAAGVLVAAVIGAAAMWLLRPDPPAPTVTRSTKGVYPAGSLDAGPVAGVSFQPTPGGSRTALVWTPDGRSLVFVGRRDGVQQVYVLDLNADEARPLDDTEGARVAAVSPDGEWVAFWANGKIRKVPFRGGPAVDIAPGGGIGLPPVGFVWPASDYLLYAQFKAEAPILQIPIEGPPSQQPLVDRAKPITTVAESEDMHFMPWPLPNGRDLLVTVRKGGWTWGEDEVVALTPATGRRKLLLRDADDARYVASGGMTGHLVFLRRGVLFAVAFDPERLEILGKEAVVLTQTVAQALTGGHSAIVTGAGQFAVSSTGTLAYAPGPMVPDPETALVTVDRAGRVTLLPAPPHRYGYLRLSPDGRRLGVVIRELNEVGLWAYDLDRHTVDPINRDGEVWSFDWSPDGRRVVFGWLKGGRRSLASAPVDRSAAPAVLTPGFFLAPCFEPDGRQLMATQGTGRIVRVNADAKVTPLVPGSNQPDLSPDGRWLAYTSAESGRDEVYVRSYPDLVFKERVSVDGGDNPAWHPNGRELFFVSATGGAGKRWMMAADFSPGPPPRIDHVRSLFEFEPSALALHADVWRNYDTDGERFYTVRRPPPTPPPVVTQINIIENWFEELKAKAPPGRR